MLGIKKEWRLLASHAEGMARIRVMVANDFMMFDALCDRALQCCVTAVLLRIIRSLLFLKHIFRTQSKNFVWNSEVFKTILAPKTHVGLGLLYYVTC